MPTGQQKRSLEPIIATPPVKHLRQSDVCRYNDTDKPLKPGVDMVKDRSEILEVEKNRDFSEKGDAMRSLLEQVSPNGQDQVSTPSKKKQLHDCEFPLRELHVVERMQPTLELQAQCTLQSCGTNSSVNRSHTQWLPSSSFSAIQNQAFEQNILPLEVLDEEVQARYDIQDGLPHRRVPLGSNFQAVVPSWKSVIAGRFEACQNEFGAGIDDSSRWLGFQVWPLAESESEGNEDEIGKGRCVSCTCLSPGSIDCVRLHIQEENAKLKVTLGEAYQLWGFHEIGEAVSQHWTLEEEGEFKYLVKTHPASSEKSFWHYLPSLFPNRSTRDFVDYYFNVFVLQRRAIQNRVDPENIDSDDDDCSLTGSDIDESEEYVTDLEEVFGREDGSEDGEDESWNVIEGGTETSSEVSTYESDAQSDQHTSSNHDLGYIQDNATNPGLMEAFVSSSTSKKDALADLPSLNQMIHSPQSISSWHHIMQASEMHVEGTGYIAGEGGCGGSKVSDRCPLEVDDHDVHEDSLLVNTTAEKKV